MISRGRLRVVLVALVVASSLGVAAGYATRPRTADPEPTTGVTVVTQQGRERLGGTSRLVAFRADGSVLYEHDRFDAYFDVDPLPGTRRTVEFLGVDFEPHGACPDRVSRKGRWCARNVYVRANLTTGETSVVYTRYLPKLHKLHDVDRLNDTHLLVANIHANQVEVVDARTGDLEWVWNANESYDYPESGGSRGDWTHLNDVEVVRDGWVMVSLRNHDQVVFIDPGRGVVEGWTLGCDDCRATLFEQHNPDYVPAERGGPAVVVADSENHRVVQYERRDGQWVRTWTWTSARTAWPRDADLLPGGTVLVTDSHADRVVEVAPNGSIVWSVTLGNPYEAERLGTGDESTGARPHPPGRQLAEGGPLDRLLVAVRGALPARWYSTALFVMPYWVGMAELFLAVLGALSLAGWVLAELAWLLRRLAPPGPADLWTRLDR